MVQDLQAMTRFRDLVIIIAGRALLITCSLITLRLFTSVLLPEEVGRASVISSSISWFVLLLVSPVDNYIYRRAVEWCAEGTLLRNLLRNFATYLAVVAVVAVSLLLLLNRCMAESMSLSIPSLIFLSIGYILVREWVWQPVMVLNIMGHRLGYVALMNGATWIGLAFSILLVHWRGPRAEYWLSGPVLAHLALLTVSLPVFLRVGSRTPASTAGDQVHTSHWLAIRGVFDFSWPQIIYGVLYWLQTQSYRFILAENADLITVGLFATGFSLGMMPTLMFDQLFNEFYTPLFYQAISNSSKQEQVRAWNEMASAYFPALILVGAFAAVSGPFLARFLVGERFQGVGWLSLWGALAVCGAQASTAIGMAGRARMNTRILVWPNLCGAVVAVSGVAVLSRWSPLGGTGLALALATATSAVLIMLQVRRLLPVQFPWRRIGLATLISLPLVATIAVIRTICVPPNMTVSLIVLVAGGSYLLAAQFSLARPWLKIPLPASFAGVLTET